MMGTQPIETAPPCIRCISNCPDTTRVQKGLTTLLFWQHTGLDLHEDEPTPAAESGEHWRPIWPVTSPSPRPSVDRIAVPAAESDCERTRASVSHPEETTRTKGTGENSPSRGCCSTGRGRCCSSGRQQGSGGRGRGRRHGRTSWV